MKVAGEWPKKENRGTNKGPTGCSGETRTCEHEGSVSKDLINEKKKMKFKIGDKVVLDKVINERNLLDLCITRHTITQIDSFLKEGQKEVRANGS